MKYHSVLLRLVALIAIGLIFIGVYALIAPIEGARGFGVQVTGSDTFAYLWAAAVRDIVLGLLLIALLWMRVSPRVLAVFIAVTALIPFGDVLNVYVNVGTRNVPALMLHGSSAVFLCGLAFFLLHEGRNTNQGRTE